MEKIPTAKKVYHAVTGCVLESHHNPDIEKAMIEFAKLHVEAALEEASEAATINKNKGQVTGREFGNVFGGSYSINQPSILNSYSLDNIK